MVEREVVAAVDEETFTAFLKRVDTYMSDNPVIVRDSSQHTSELLERKPFLYVPCQARSAGQCPDQDSKLPLCHNCPSAEVAVNNLRVAANPFRIKVDKTEKYPGGGSLWVSMQHPARDGHMTFEVNGDKGGLATIFLHEMRDSLNDEE